MLPSGNSATGSPERDREYPLVGRRAPVPVSGVAVQAISKKRDFAEPARMPECLGAVDALAEGSPDLGPDRSTCRPELSMAHAPLITSAPPAIEANELMLESPLDDSADGSPVSADALSGVKRGREVDGRGDSFPAPHSL
jgi:hypothetical protein